VLPETGAVGSAGCSTDSCLNTAYLSEEEEDEDPDTGVSMAGTLYEVDKTYTSQKKRSMCFYKDLYRDLVSQIKKKFDRYTISIRF